MTSPGPVSQPTDESAAGGAGQWLMLAVLLLGQFMGLVDVLIVNVAMPEIGVNLHASGASLQLVVGGYTIAYAMLLITGARLGDLYGRRRMYQLGLVLFTLMSLACGLAPNSTTLVVFRFIQGAGAAVMVPQIISVIQMQFTGRSRAKALSAYGVVLSIGASAGLVLGGVLVNANLFNTEWRPVFLVNVPIGILLMALIPRLVPADVPSGRRRLDLVGLAIAAPAVFLIVLPLVVGHEEGWPAWTFVCIAVGIVLAGVFVPVERRIAARGGDPLMNLDVLRPPGVAAGMITLSCMQITFGGFLFIFTLHLQSGLGESALRAGLTFLPMSATFGFFGFYWRKLPERVHHMLAPIGLALSVVSYVLIASAMHDGGGAGALMWTALALNGVGLGLSVSPLLTQSLVRVPMSLAVDASGLLTTTVQLGQVIGIAAYGTVFLSLEQGSHLPSVARISGSALSTTCYWLVLLGVVGLVPAVALARTVLRAKRPAAPKGSPVPAVR
jgi:EmrB/QacA subfamily drug resistance transporter